MTVDLSIVGRVRKAFGLKGELLVQPITNEPDAVFASGRSVFATADAADRNTESRGDNAPKKCLIERSRAFKDGWLVKLEGVNDKTAADLWRGVVFSVPQAELTPPQGNELYLHELVGIAVRDEPHGELGVIAGWYQLPQGIVLEVRGPAWRADVPFNDAFIEQVNRDARTILVRLPDGLLEPVKPETV